MDFNVPKKPEDDKPSELYGHTPANPQNQPPLGQQAKSPLTVFTPDGQVSQSSQPAFPSFQPGVPQGGFGHGPAVVPSVPSKRRFNFNRKKVLLGAGIAAIVALLGGGYAFAFYLPNKPENVWKTALERTAIGYDRLIALASDEKRQDALAKAEIDGDFKFKTTDMSTDGSFNFKADDKNIAGSIDVGLGVTRLKGEVITKMTDNSRSPDVYLKLSGVKGLGGLLGGDESTAGVFDSLDSQWISIDHTLFDNLAGAEQDDTDLPALDSGMIVDAAKTIGTVNRKYLLTSDGSKAVLELRKFVGNETVDGKQTKHYLVGFNKPHLKSYVTELGTELNKTELGTWFKANYGTPISEALDTQGLADSVDTDIKDSDTLDVWVDAANKVIYKVRTTDPDNVSNFVELGLDYKNGQEFPFFLKGEVDGNEFELRLTSNVGTNVTNLSFTYASGKDNGSITATVKPLKGDVKADVPASSITLAEALDRIGLGEYFQMLSDPTLYENAFEGTLEDSYILPNEL